ncbi:hypothetical protein Bca101_013977 [Brassica carinata]
MEIGYPTEVKHVAHVGWEGSSGSAPAWMSEFKAAVEPLSPRASSFSHATHSNSFLALSSTDFDQSSSQPTISDRLRDVPPIPVGLSKVPLRWLCQLKPEDLLLIWVDITSVFSILPLFFATGRSALYHLHVSHKASTVTSWVVITSASSGTTSMALRYSRSEKGKWQAPPSPPAKRPPVRIPDGDFNDLIAANKLTVIGRVTNPNLQKPRSVVDFMPQVWGLEGRVTGRALGLDKFQFKFESEADLAIVLEKGPYHYKRWMLLLQRWEPSVSEHFPSTIAFWVRFHGIPLHLWSDKTFDTIGEQWGKITDRAASDAKIRVEFNGLQPLEMTVDVQLPTDEVIEVEVEYIKIEKHCFTCFSLFHEESDCPKRSRHAPPPKERKLGITQRIALQRIEAEKNRHDERRGYRRAGGTHPGNRLAADSQVRNSARDDREDSYYKRRPRTSRQEPVSSTRSTRSKGPYERPVSNQYRRGGRDRHSPVSPPIRSPLLGSSRLGNPEGSPWDSSNSKHRGGQVSHPSLTLRERLGSSGEKGSSLSKSGDRPSALKRLSDHALLDEESADRVHIADSGRLQYVEIHLDSDDLLGTDEDAPPIPDQSHQRISATLRLGEVSTANPAILRNVPVSPQTKPAGKRRITRSAANKPIRRSPLPTLGVKKATNPRASGAARRRLYSNGTKEVPCIKDGSSNSKGTGTSARSRQPKTVIVPGITKGRKDFRPPPNPLP